MAGEYNKWIKIAQELEYAGDDLKTFVLDRQADAMKEKKIQVELYLRRKRIDANIEKAETEANRETRQEELQKEEAEREMRRELADREAKKMYQELNTKEGKGKI